MAKVVGVRFRNVGKIYYFDPKDYEIKSGDHVIVETARGIEYGKVVLAPQEVPEEKVVRPLKEVLRPATEEDQERERKNRIQEREALKVCQKKIREHNLDMKLIDAEYTFDNNKVLFYFTADGRIDFRQLVKDLASIFKTRIELRQIGVRDETKILGGIGNCGRCLCCHTYLSEFAPVSIKMAKEQNLSLNQTKISGVCGRLMCCLKNEQETYEELNKKLPGIGSIVTMPDGVQGTVQSVNVLRQRVRVIYEENDEKTVEEFAVEDLKFRPKKRKVKVSDKELKELEGLEDEEDFLDELPAQEPKKKNENKKSDGIKGENFRPEKDRTEKEKTDRERPEKEKADREKPEKEKPDREKPEKEKPDREKPEKEKPDRERSDREKPEKMKPGKERQEKQKTENGKSEGGRNRRRSRRSGKNNASQKQETVE